VSPPWLPCSVATSRQPCRHRASDRLVFTPGVALALPGGAIGQKFGDKTTVLAALTLMLIGNLAMTVSDSWSVQIAGRLLGGAGGVLLNVQMTKMVADWFAGKEIATAMAIFVKLHGLLASRSHC